MPAGSGHRRVNEAIVRAIQDQIRRGELKPGDRLPPERQLAEMFDASRSSVREALRALELSGLIYSRHGEGNFVSEAPGGAALTLLDFLERQRASLLDLSEARKLFEPFLATLAASRATREDLEELHRAAEEEATQLQAGETQAAFRSDRAFHHAVAVATGNQELVKLHSYLSDLVAGGRREALENDVRRAQSAMDHRRLYQAIARRDGAAARAAMLRHLENVERILMDAVVGYQRAAARLAPTAGVAPSRPQRSGARRAARRAGPA
ncbi:MAG: FadR family transcriptional regulator [Acidobacteria bacterium]|nr:FadR family transcriptional regulator [Acidobacteriota bacterium]